MSSSPSLLLAVDTALESPVANTSSDPSSLHLRTQSKYVSSEKGVGARDIFSLVWLSIELIFCIEIVLYIRVVDPDPDSEDFVDPDPYWESGSGSRGKKIKKFQWKNALFSYFCKNILPIKRYNYFLKKIWMNNTNIFDFI
jgi:hypothetical protein